MKNLLHKIVLLAIASSTWITAVAQTQALSPQDSYNGHVLDGMSYEERQSFRPGKVGVGDKDPNVYVYSEEFAKRFSMPMQWVSSELKGADAAAFRVRYGYTQCGWGGDPAACGDKNFRCEMDLFFDNKRYPLPWNPKARNTEIDRNKSSLWFFGMAGYQDARGTSKPYFDEINLFTHPQTGKVLRWQYSYDDKSTNGAAAVFSYDREIFKSMTILTLSLSQCYGSPLRELWLGEGYVTYASDVKHNPNLLYHRIAFPTEFQTKMKAVSAPFENGTAAFFKQEGEKAMKSLQTNPVPSTPIVPLR